MADDWREADHTEECLCKVKLKTIFIVLILSNISQNYIILNKIILKIK
jgi:hypothetical protein